jgi:hypothetical protein
LYQLGTDAASNGDRVSLSYTPNLSNFHAYVHYLPDNNADNDPGDVQFPGRVFIGDETENSFSTPGLTINQGANDDEAFAIKSSDVAQPATTVTESDTYLRMKKYNATGGGLISGFSAADLQALVIEGYYGSNTPTEYKGCVEIRGYKSDGSTGVEALTTDETVFNVRNDTTILQYLNGDGEAYFLGRMLIGGETENTKCALGLTINQGANDDEILAFKSSDVDHGWLVTETDTFGFFQKIHADTGGLHIKAICDDGVAERKSFQLHAMGGTPWTGFGDASQALMQFYCSEHDGANNYADLTAGGIVWSLHGRLNGGWEALHQIDSSGAQWLKSGATFGGDILFGANTISGTGDIHCDTINTNTVNTDATNYDGTSQIIFATDGTIGTLDHQDLMALTSGTLTVDGDISCSSVSPSNGWTGEIPTVSGTITVEKGIITNYA